MDVSSAALSSAVVSFLQKVLFVDATSNLHPFFTQRLDSSPIRITTIAHAFNYRVAVLRDGVKSATRVGRSRRAEGRILEDMDVPWGHQVAVMFQIVSALALEVPAFLQNDGDMRTIVVGVVNVSPQIIRCLCSRFVPRAQGEFTCTGGSGARMSHVSGIGAGHPGSVPFVSHRPGALKT